MGNDAGSSNRNPMVVVALVAAILGTHVLLAQTTDLDGWPRSAIAIGVGIVVIILGSIIFGRKKQAGSPARE